MTLTKASPTLRYYAVVSALSAAAFLVFLFTIGGGRPSGPGLFLALAVFTLGVIAHLLYRAARTLTEPDEDPAAGAVSGARRKEIEREYQALKRALKELELDHAMGKLSEGDYQEIRSRYRERAVRALRQLDQAESYRKQIELDLKARREALAARHGAGAPKGGAASAGAQEKAPAAPAEPAPALTSPAAPACSACGARNDADAAFCKKCGVRLQAQAAGA